jgi:hypothetical protein
VRALEDVQGVRLGVGEDEFAALSGGRDPEHFAGFARGLRRRRDGAVARDLANAVEEVGDVQVARVVRGQTERRLKRRHARRAVAPAHARGRTRKRAHLAVFEPPDAVVAGVGDVQRAVGSDRKPRGIGEARVHGGAVPVAPRARERRDVVGCRARDEGDAAARDAPDALGSRIAHVDAAVARGDDAVGLHERGAEQIAVVGAQPSVAGEDRDRRLRDARRRRRCGRRGLGRAAAAAGEREKSEQERHANVRSEVRSQARS